MRYGVLELSAINDRVSLRIRKVRGKALFRYNEMDAITL